MWIERVGYWSINFQDDSQISLEYIYMAYTINNNKVVLVRIVNAMINHSLFTKYKTLCDHI